MGVVIVAYFGAMCITGSENIIRYATWQLVCVGIALIIPSIIGAIASFCYFIRCKNDKIWSRLISVATIWGIIRIVINNYQMIRYAEQYLSMNTTVRLVLQMAIYGLILYQTFTLTKKRKNASPWARSNGCKSRTCPGGREMYSRTARVSTVRWNLKEAVSESLVRRTEIAYKARLRVISWQRTAKSNNYHVCRSRVNAADIWRERACTLSVEVSQRFH